MKKRILPLILLLALFTLAPFAGASPSNDLFVSPSGNDSNDGSFKNR